MLELMESEEKRFSLPPSLSLACCLTLLFILSLYFKMLLLTVAENEIHFSSQNALTKEEDPGGYCFKLNMIFIVLLQWHSQIITLCYLHK